MLNNGRPKELYIDDVIPTINGKPAFGSSRRGDLWVSLLEKAWAKSCGTYHTM